MDKTSAIVCHAFLLKCPSDQRAALINYLPPVEAKMISELPATLEDPSSGFSDPEEDLGRIHFSWFTPFLRTLPEAEIRFFLSCFNATQVEGLKQQLLFTNTAILLTPLAAPYLKKILLEQICDKELLPIACLPTSPLNILLDLTYSEFLPLIDLLSMHDLSVEIRHIIDTQKLKQIYSLLNKSQQSYLKTLTHKKEAVAFKKIGLNNWNGDTEALRGILHQRGINRLAKALYGMDPSLIWYVAHSLDVERGNTLKKLCVPLDHPRAGVILGEQIVSLIQAIKNLNPTKT